MSCVLVIGCRCPAPFDFAFENQTLDKPTLQRLMFEQIAVSQSHGARLMMIAMVASPVSLCGAIIHAIISTPVVSAIAFCPGCRRTIRTSCNRQGSPQRGKVRSTVLVCGAHCSSPRCDSTVKV